MGLKAKGRLTKGRHTLEIMADAKTRKERSEKHKSGRVGGGMKKGGTSPDKQRPACP